MSNGVSSIPRLTNPTAYMLSQVTERVDRYTKRRWERMMNQKLSGAMQAFYGGDDRALQEVMEIASETGQTAQIIPVIRDRMREIAVTRQEQRQRGQREEVGRDMLGFLGVPEGLPQEAEDAWVRMYGVDPTGAVDLIQEAARRQRGEATYDFSEHPYYPLFTKGLIKREPMIKWLDSLQVEEGVVTGPPTYDLQEEDIYPTYPGMYQTPGTRLVDPSLREAALAAGQPITPDMLQFQPSYPVDERWMAENVDTDYARRYVERGSPDYLNPMMLIEGYVGDKSVASLRNLRGRALIDFGNLWDTRSAGLKMQAMSALGPGTAGNEQLRRLTTELGMKNPGFWRNIFNPDSVVRWLDAPQILFDALEEHPDKEALTGQYQFVIDRMKEIKTWEKERIDYLRVRIREFDEVLLGPEPKEEEGSGGGESGREATTSQARLPETTPPVVGAGEGGEIELPDWWAINEKPEDYIPYLRQLEATGGDAEEYLGLEVFEKMDPPLPVALAQQHIEWLLEQIRK